jgi:hypothetical protein
MKKLTNSTKVLRYVKKHPLAKAKEVASAVGVSVNTVYQAVYLAKKKLSNGQVVSSLVPHAEASLALFGDKEIQRANSVPRERGRPSKVKTFFATSNKSIKADNVNHPPHYKAGGIETIDFIEAKSLNYNLGNVVKYITRADHKGSKLEDLKKAQWYLNREVSNLEKK